MVVIGLTGNVAAGKSSVAKAWQDLGVPIVSADQLARDAVEPGRGALEEIVQVFGPEVLQADGTLHRKELGRRVFEDPAELRALEAILHPAIETLRQHWLEERRAEGHSVVALEVPLLFQVGLNEMVDVAVVVDAPEEVRIQRMVTRRDMTREEATAVMRNQPPSEELRRRADYVIENNGTTDELVASAESVLSEIQEQRVRE